MSGRKRGMFEMFAEQARFFGGSFMDKKYMVQKTPWFSPWRASKKIWPSSEDVLGT